MIKQLSPLAIVVGLLASQALAACLALALVICMFMTHGNRALTAFFEHGPSIALTLALGLLTTGFGGYVSMMTPKKSLINAIGVGVVTFALNVWIFVLIGHGYAVDHRWLLWLNALLTVPAAALGGYLFWRFDTALPRPRG